MNHKVLLADDSLTIQKVIKITLANQPYDITEASSEEELFQKLSIVQPKLVFLDFNLSEKYTGYELTSKIKSLAPSAKVLLLLGTFDTVDDAAMEKCGASDKIVKPFDSNKFIAICRQLIDTFVDEELIPYPQAKKEIPAKIEDSDEQWTVSHSTEQKFQEAEKPLDQSFPNLKNALEKEVSDWGMSVPGVISESSSHDQVADLPPVIGLHEIRETKIEAVKDQTKYPESSDLDYPTIEELAAKPEPVVTKPTSKLVSIDTLDTKVGMELEGSYVPNESDVKSIQAQIREEVEENLWLADEFEDLKREVSAKIEEVKSNFQPTLNDFDESLFKPIDDQGSITWNDSDELFPADKGTPVASSVNMDDIRLEMEIMVKKYVKEYMDQMFQKNAEKVAWEVIPDLAENLIRQELSKISNKIINDQA